MYFLPDPRVLQWAVVRVQVRHLFKELGYVCLSFAATSDDDIIERDTRAHL